MNIINLFSVPIFCTQLESNEHLTHQEVSFLKNIQLNKQYGDDGNYLSGEIDILEKPELARIKNLCDRYVHHYTENILGIEDNFKMFRSWLSKNERGTKHDSHSHRNTMISCILYFDENMTQEPMDPINFGQSALDQIFKTFQFQFKVKEHNQYNNNVLTIYPKTNTLLVFPGWIQHEVPTATSTTKRYCLGTNYFFNGESGEGYHNIKIDVNK
jgi:uncharacterized protein (TIGR02466 family)